MSNNEEDRAEQKRAKERAQSRARERAIAEEENLRLLLSNKPLSKGEVRLIQRPSKSLHCQGGVCNASRPQLELFSGPKLRISRQRNSKLRLASNVPEEPQSLKCLQGLCTNNRSRRENRLNEMSGRLGEVDTKLNETLAMFRALMPVVQETRDAAVEGQENIAGVVAKLDTGFGKIGKLFKSEHAKITNPFHYIYLYYYTLYTLLRLACETLIVGSKPFREYTLALPCGLSLLVILVYIIMFLLLIFVYEIGIFFGSVGLLHYYGRQHDVFELIVGTSIKLIGSVCMTLWDLKGFFRPYGKIMKNSFMSSFKLDESLKDSVAESAVSVKDYVQHTTSTAVSNIVNQSISAAVDRLPTMTNISSAVAAGLASHAIGAKDAIASGAADLGSAVASGASDLGSAVASGASKAAGKASEVGAVAGRAATNAASKAAERTAEMASAAAKKASNWFYSKKDNEPHGGGLNVLDRFKEFDDIHILNATQLVAFNKSKIGLMLEKLKTNMDVMIVHNVERHMGHPLNEKAIYAMNCSINLILDKGIPLIIGELNISAPLCEYIKHHKVVLKKTYNQELYNSLCKFDIVSFYEHNQLSKDITSRKTLKHIPRRHARLTRGRN
jgi:hypothetical protein